MTTGRIPPQMNQAMLRLPEKNNWLPAGGGDNAMNANALVLLLGCAYFAQAPPALATSEYP